MPAYKDSASVHSMAARPFKSATEVLRQLKSPLVNGIHDLFDNSDHPYLQALGVYI